MNFDAMNDSEQTDDARCDAAVWISDALADYTARLELAQRFLWAHERGIDPLRADLLNLANDPHEGSRLASVQSSACTNAA